MNDMPADVTPALPASQPSALKGVTAETVLSVHHWTDRLFSFTCTRAPTLRFENGQFAMIGLEVDGKPLLRAYSMASANYEEQLEFLSIKVPDGPLTSRLQHVKVGDTVLVGRKPTGTLLLGNMLPGRNLYFLSTGTGLAPFMSLVKDPEAYERFDKVVLVHGNPPCRRAGLHAVHLRRPRRARVPRRLRAREADVLPDGDARGVPQPGPHHRPDPQRQAVLRPRPAPRSTRSWTG